MRSVSFYYANGTVLKVCPLNEETIGWTHGMKTRCHLKDGTIRVGFSDAYGCEDTEHYNHTVYDYIILWTFKHFDDKTGFIEGDHDKYETISERVAIEDILEMKSILHSHPRWGVKIQNGWTL